MGKFKKLLSILLVCTMIIAPCSLLNGVFAQTDNNSNTLTVNVTTDKSSYTAYGIAEITVKVTNTSDETVNNISAEAVFKQLAPVGKNNETFKEVDALESGESFTFLYKATLDANKVNVGFFEKILLWFVRLFNGGYNATSHNIEADIENITQIKFGKYTAENVVAVEYEENQHIIDSNFKFLDFTTDTFNINVGETKTITFTASVSSENFLSDGTIKLYEKNDGFIGTLHNDKKNSDSEINNQVFTGSFSFSPAKREIKTFYAEANGIKSNIIKVGFTQSISDNENNELEAFKENIAQLKTKYYLNHENNYSNDEILQNAKNAYNEIIYYLDHSEIIKSYNTTTFCIMVEFNFGINMAVDLTDLFPDENTEQKNYQNAYSDNSNQYQTTLQTQNLKQGIACLSVIGNHNGFINAANAIANSNDNYVIYKYLLKKQVTIDSLKDLADCRVIIIDAHGCNSPEHGYGILINEKVTDKKNKELEEDGDLYVTVHPMDNGKGYAVFESFFEKYYSSGDFDNSLVYLGTCHGGDNNLNINNILLRKGAQTVLSYSNVVKPSYCSKMIETIAMELSNGANINDAVGKAKVKHGEYSPTASTELFEEFITWIKGGKYQKAELIIHGSKEFKLSNGYISGKVKSNNTPIQGAIIEITNAASKTYSVTSKEDGYFSCPLSAGTYTVTISKPDYETKVIKNVKVTDELANNLGDIYLSMIIKDDISSVHGTIKDSETKEAISNVKVTLRSEDTQATYTTVTDEIGDFNFEDLTAGRYTLSFEHEDYTINGTHSFTLNEGLMFVFIDPFEFTKKDSSDGDEEEKPDPDRTIIASGICGAEGDNVKWVLYDDGELIISGSGEMKDFESEVAPWNSYQNYIKTVEIKKGVTSIGDYAFEDCKSLANIDISDSVISIGKSAFRSCTNLTDIVIPEGVTLIESYTFYECDNLARITIPDSVTGIGYLAFYHCKNIVNISLPKNLTIIAQEAFDGCSSLTDITLPGGLTSTGYMSFARCSSLANVTISYGVKTIDDYSFFDCTSLANISIPDSVTSIGRDAFNGCKNLANIKIPDSVTSIGASAFKDCSTLTSIEIPDGVTSIERATFSGCSNLESIKIPESIEKIHNETKEFRYGVFYACDKLVTVYYGGTENDWYQLTKSNGNVKNALENATIHYNS